MPPESSSLEAKTNICAPPSVTPRREPPVLAALREPGSGRREERWRERIEACGKAAWIAENEAGLPVAVVNLCAHRLCPRCGLARSVRIAATIEREIKGWNAVRFITLTLAPGQGGLRSQTHRLLSSFRELRRGLFWRRCVRRGFWCLEVTRGREGVHWHVHLHLLVDGSYVPHAQLKTAWHRITGDSYIVDLRFAHDRRNAARYLAKYVQKQADFRGWSPTLILQYAVALHNVRTFGTFGALHASRIDRQIREARPRLKRPLISVTALLAAARREDARALAALELAANFGPTWRRLLNVKGPTDNRPPPAASEYEAFVALCSAIARV